MNASTGIAPYDYLDCIEMAVAKHLKARRGGSFYAETLR